MPSFPSTPPKLCPTSVWSAATRARPTSSPSTSPSMVSLIHSSTNSPQSRLTFGRKNTDTPNSIPTCSACEPLAPYPGRMLSAHLNPEKYRSRVARGHSSLYATQQNRCKFVVISSIRQILEPAFALPARLSRPYQHDSQRSEHHEGLHERLAGTYPCALH